MTKMSRAKIRTCLIPAAAVAAAVCFLFTAAPLAGQAKRLQVVLDQAAVHLEPDPGSPVMSRLASGATVTLASAQKMRKSWFYVYFASPGSGSTRAGYILDEAVRKLFPEVKAIEICAEGEIDEPARFDLNDEASPLFSWDMGREALLRAEGRPFSQSQAEEGDILRYKQPVLGKRCLVEYLFAGDRLSAVRLHLVENYADKSRYIEDYAAIKDYLVRRLGEPRQDLVTWQDDSYRRESGQWGRALLLGHLEYRTQWIFEGTELLVVLAGNGNGISFGAECTNLQAKGSASF